jgi:drug/metabolite transporter (DMT)-like permease
VAGGIVAIRGIRRGVHRRDVALALGVGAAIAAYTLIDKEGLKHAGPLPYLWVVNSAAALAYVPLLAWGRGSRVTATVAWMRNGRRSGAKARLRSGAAVLRAAIERRSVVAGIGVFSAYALTLAALARAPAAAVSALRETSVLFATAFGATVLHERVGPARAAGAVAVVAGVVLIAVG